jgi:hypothetical protein
MSGPQFQTLVNRIYSLDTRIRYAAFINVKGEVLAGGIRGGIKSLDSDETEKVRLQQLATSGLARRHWEQAYGKYAYTMMRFQNLLLAQFPYRDLALIVSMAPNAPREVFDQISELLNKNS